MSPATSIMHYFTTAALKTHVHFEQAEDEISAINMALGASYAGVDPWWLRQAAVLR